MLRADARRSAGDPTKTMLLVNEAEARHTRRGSAPWRRCSGLAAQHVVDAEEVVGRQEGMGSSGPQGGERGAAGQRAGRGVERRKGRGPVGGSVGRPGDLRGRGQVDGAEGPILAGTGGLAGLRLLRAVRRCGLLRPLAVTAAAARASRRGRRRRGPEEQRGQAPGRAAAEQRTCRRHDHQVCRHRGPQHGQGTSAAGVEAQGARHQPSLFIPGARQKATPGLALRLLIRSTGPRVTEGLTARPPSVPRRRSARGRPAPR